MITNQKTFYLGIFLLLIPFLGVPESWKIGLMVLSALALIFFSIDFNVTLEIKGKHHEVPPEKNPVPTLPPISDISLKKPRAPRKRKTLVDIEKTTEKSNETDNTISEINF